MIYYLIIPLIALLDTLIGNRFFPGKVKVIKLPDRKSYPYIVMKITRFFLIPFKIYLTSEHISRDMLSFSFSIDNAEPCTKETAFKLAKIYSNTYNVDTLNESIVVWSSRTKPIKTDVELLYMSAGKAFMDNNEVEGNLILDEIKLTENVKS